MSQSVDLPCGCSNTSTGWKDNVANFAALPLSGNNIGDVRLTLDNNSLWEWNGTHWVALGFGNVDGGTASRAFASNMNINGGNASSRP